VTNSNSFYRQKHNIKFKLRITGTSAKSISRVEDDGRLQPFPLLLPVDGKGEGAKQFTAFQQVGAFWRRVGCISKFALNTFPPHTLHAAKRIELRERATAMM